MRIVDANQPEPQLMFIDTGEEGSPASTWWILGLVGLAVALGLGGITSGIDDGTPRVEVTGDGACLWSGAEVAAGVLEVEFVNNFHKAVWVKFAPIVEGATIDDVIASAPVTGDLHDYENVPLLIDRGQNTRAVRPDTTVAFNMSLTRAGEYAVSCSMTEPTFVAGVPMIAPKAVHVVRGH